MQDTSTEYCSFPTAMIVKQPAEGNHKANPQVDL